MVLLPWLSSRVRARVGKRCERTSYLCRMNLNAGTGKVTAKHTGRKINRPNSEENSKRWKRNKSQVVPINLSKKGALDQGDLFSECQQTARSPRTRRDPDRQLYSLLRLPPWKSRHGNAAGPRQAGNHLWIMDHGQTQPSATTVLPFMVGAQGRRPSSRPVGRWLLPSAHLATHTPSKKLKKREPSITNPTHCKSN